MGRGVSGSPGDYLAETAGGMRVSFLAVAALLMPWTFGPALLSALRRRKCASS